AGGQVEAADDAQGGEQRHRQRAPRILALLSSVCQRLEAGEGEHGHRGAFEDAANAVGRKFGPVGCRAEDEAADGDAGQQQQLHGGDDGRGRPGGGDARGQQHQREGDPVRPGVQEAGGRQRHVGGGEVADGPASQGVQGAAEGLRHGGHGQQQVGEHRPADDEGWQLAHGDVGECVAAAGPGHQSGEFHVAEPGEEAGDGAECEAEHGCRAWGQFKKIMSQVDRQRLSGVSMELASARLFLRNRLRARLCMALQYMLVFFAPLRELQTHEAVWITAWNAAMSSGTQSKTMEPSPPASQPLSSSLSSLVRPAVAAASASKATAMPATAATSAATATAAASEAAAGFLHLNIDTAAFHGFSASLESSSHIFNGGLDSSSAGKRHEAEVGGGGALARPRLASADAAAGHLAALAKSLGQVGLAHVGRQVAHEHLQVVRSVPVLAALFVGWSAAGAASTVLLLLLCRRWCSSRLASRRWCLRLYRLRLAVACTASAAEQGGEVPLSAWRGRLRLLRHAGRSFFRRCGILGRRSGRLLGFRLLSGGLHLLHVDFSGIAVGGIASWLVPLVDALLAGGDHRAADAVGFGNVRHWWWRRRSSGGSDNGGGFAGLGNGGSPVADRAFNVGGSIGGVVGVGEDLVLHVELLRPDGRQQEGLHEAAHRAGIVAHLAAHLDEHAAGRGRQRVHHQDLCPAVGQAELLHPGRDVRLSDGRRLHSVSGQLAATVDEVRAGGIEAVQILRALVHAGVVDEYELATYAASLLKQIRLNHRLHFVDPADPIVHTNTVEGTWAYAKRKICNITELHVSPGVPHTCTHLASRTAMDSLCKPDPDFAAGSLDSDDMDDMIGLPHQLETQFSAESCVDFRPRSSTWHCSDRPAEQLGSVAPLTVHCPQSPFPSGLSGTPELGPSAESSARHSPFHHSAGSARSSLSPRPSDGQWQHLHASSASQKRRNAWGNQSYADLISQAIESSPHGRLTLSEIYDWMIKNISYFGNKGDTNSSAGWKNSVRHNLSLHSKFVRVQNEQTGKSSYWTIDYGVRDRASYRRRAATADVTKSPEMLKKRHAAVAAAAAAAAAATGRGNCRQASGSGTGQMSSSMSSDAASPSLMPAAVPMELQQPQPMPPQELQVADVLHQLVPQDRLLDPSQPIETLLIESLTDAVLESCCDGAATGVAGREAANSGCEAAGDPSLRNITTQLHLMTCRHELSNCLPDIQEGGEADGPSAMEEAPWLLEVVGSGASRHASKSYLFSHYGIHAHSLTDAVLESCCDGAATGVAGREAANSGCEAAGDPSLRNITTQLHLMTCRHELSNCLPDIQEGGEADGPSAMEEAPAPSIRATVSIVLFLLFRGQVPLGLCHRGLCVRCDPGCWPTACAFVRQWVGKQQDWGCVFLLVQSARRSWLVRLGTQHWCRDQDSIVLEAYDCAVVMGDEGVNRLVELMSASVRRALQQDINVAQNVQRPAKPPKYCIGDNFRLWLQRFNAYCEASQIVEDDRRPHLLSFLDLNTAFAAVENIQLEEGATYDDFTDALLERFQQHRTAEDFKLELESRVQKEGETYETYADVLLELARNAYPDEDMPVGIINSFARDRFKKGIRAPEHVKEYVMLQQPATLTDAVRCVRRKEAAGRAAKPTGSEQAYRKIASTVGAVNTGGTSSDGLEELQQRIRDLEGQLKRLNQAPPPQQSAAPLSSGSAHSRGPGPGLQGGRGACVYGATPSHLAGQQQRQAGACFQCGNIGHLARECPSRSGMMQQPQSNPAARTGGPRRCYACNQPGHLAKNCRQQPVDTPSLMMHPTSVYVSCQIGGQVVSACVDSGAAVTIINEALLQRVRKTWTKSPPSIQPHKSTIHAANGSPINISAICQLPLMIGESELSMTALVSSSVSYELLMGADFLLKHNCRIDFQDGVLHLADASVPLRFHQRPATVCRILASERIVVPPGAEKIASGRFLMKGGRGRYTRSPGVIEESQDRKRAGSAVLARSLVMPTEDARVPVRLANFSEVPVTIRKGETVAWYHPLDPLQPIALATLSEAKDAAPTLEKPRQEESEAAEELLAAGMAIPTEYFEQVEISSESEDDTEDEQESRLQLIGKPSVGSEDEPVNTAVRNKLKRACLRGNASEIARLMAEIRQLYSARQAVAEVKRALLNGLKDLATKKIGRSKIVMSVDEYKSTSRAVREAAHSLEFRCVGVLLASVRRFRPFLVNKVFRRAPMAPGTGEPSRSSPAADADVLVLDAEEEDLDDLGEEATSGGMNSHVSGKWISGKMQTLRLPLIGLLLSCLSCLLWSGCALAAGSWWNLGHLSWRAAALGEAAPVADLCANVAGLSGSQTRLCRRHLALMPAVTDGLRLGIRECARQFSGRTWNCGGGGGGGDAAFTLGIAAEDRRSWRRQSEGKNQSAGEPRLSRPALCSELV
uniref:Protein Wnt n=1 Tax=Macrostomum lignano TaxID=282301 RepID=A0A1I8HG03_9PLAT